jgi:hypothetical protein
MRAGVILSTALHGAAIALVFLSWPKALPEPKDEIHLVDAELVEIAPETNIAAASPPPEPVQPPPASPPPPAPEPPPPAPPEPEPEAVPPPPPPPRPAPPPQQAAEAPKTPEPPRPKPDTEPEAAQKPRERPRAQAKAEPRKPDPRKPEPPKPEPPKPEPAAAQKPEPRAKPQTKPAAPPKAKPEPDFDLEAMARAAEKLAKSQRQPEPAAKPAEPGPTARTAAGAGTKMTATEIDALRSTISKCWNMPAGAPNPETLVVRLKLFLNQDGTVARPPELVDTAGRASSDPYFRSAAEAAMRAVLVCAPYQLPPDKFDDWSEITINFRPPL